MSLTIPNCYFVEAFMFYFSLSEVKAGGSSFLGSGISDKSILSRRLSSFMRFSRLLASLSSEWLMLRLGMD